MALLRYERSRYLMEKLKTVAPMADRLQSAPMEVRRLGLPLAVAGWDRSRQVGLVRLVSGWLYGPWGMFPGRPPPQDAITLLRALEQDDAGSEVVRSAAESEAEELLQAAKVLADALRSPEGRHGA